MICPPHTAVAADGAAAADDDDAGNNSNINYRPTSVELLARCSRPENQEDIIRHLVSNRGDGSTRRIQDGL